MSEELTYAEVQKHSTRKDLYLIIHGKVYNVSSFIDDHPGGKDALLDAGGQDATEAFEDISHSDQAHVILDSLLVGKIKRVAGDHAPKVASIVEIAVGPVKSGADTSSEILIYAVYAVLIGAVVAYVAYGYVR